MNLQAPEIPTNVDVVVIGGGIGGLVCANYLAKAGVKVILVEKHHTLGGYCSSFKRGKYYFDAGAHYLGSCRREGQIGKILTDFGLEERIKLIACEPSEVVISKNTSVRIFRDSRNTQEEFSRAFPKEASNIESFINYVTNTGSLQMFADLRRRTFRDVLDQYFKGWEIKSILATLLGNIGLPSTRAAALTSVFLFREFIFDGGYYPRGGMQAFPDLLADRLKEYGGTILLLSPAEEIKLSPRGAVTRVQVKVMGKYSHFVETKAVVANCDPNQLYTKLVKQNKWIAYWNELVPRENTVSAFMLHLGVKGRLEESSRYHCNIWSYRKGDIDEYYEGVTRNELDYGHDSFIFCSIPSFHDTSLMETGHHSLQVIVAAPYFEREVWEQLKEKMASDVYRRLEDIFPGVKNLVEVERIATPATLVKYTSNYKGAMYGWASTINQIGRERFGERTPIEGLYVVGHWAGVPSGHSGIPTVVTSGRIVARTVLSDLRKGLINNN